LVTKASTTSGGTGITTQIDEVFSFCVIVIATLFWVKFIA
jgi:hypothetical protein